MLQAFSTLHNKHKFEQVTIFIPLHDDGRTGRCATGQCCIMNLLVDECWNFTVVRNFQKQYSVRIQDVWLVLSFWEVWLVDARTGVPHSGATDASTGHVKAYILMKRYATTHRAGGRNGTIWHSIFSMLGQWDSSLNAGTIPLKTGRLLAPFYIPVYSHFLLFLSHSIGVLPQNLFRWRSARPWHLLHGIFN